MSKVVVTDQKTTIPQEQTVVKKEKKQQYNSGNREERDYHQQRPHYRKQNKPVYVEDLREKLNRIRRDKEVIIIYFL